MTLRYSDVSGPESSLVSAIVSDNRPLRNRDIMPGTPVFDMQVRDGDRLLTFDGELLAHVSSRIDGRDRWTEMRVYRTTGGSYILEKVGRSIRLHMPGCPDMKEDLPLFQSEHPGDDPDIGYTWCDQCAPPIGEEYDFPSLLVEEDRFWATLSTDPEVIIDATWRKREGYRRLPRISVDLLTELCKNDPAFEVWRTERVS
jgi:hypothetical protein